MVKHLDTDKPVVQQLRKFRLPHNKFRNRFNIDIAVVISAYLDFRYIALRIVFSIYYYSSKADKVVNF